ncbi:YcxB family protein [Thermoactinomyces sp. DSM 45892]|uniref:YcxB family protein n=1 Tax=Thermoactinomyces sp. DSM 45892 TaxID=1882753 RepID=UPI0015A04ADB|nr:YcxB family protein [Thermoactinomyces sp. DSM 45892]
MIDTLLFRGIRQAKKNGFFGAYYVELTEDSFKSESTISSMSIRWDLIHRIIECRKCYLVYTQKNCAIIIPKRTFLSEEEHQNWRKQIVLFSKKEIC